MSEKTQRTKTEATRANTALSNTPPDHQGLLVASLLLMLIGWGGLAQLVTTALPRIGGELWLFFVLLHLAITGTVLPIVRYLNVRLTPALRPVPASGVIVRQGVWVGLFAVTCAWLQIPRVLTVPLAFFVALLFLVVEIYLRLRERAAGDAYA